VTHKKQWQTLDPFEAAYMAKRPLNIPHLVLPPGLSVQAILTFLLLIQCGPAKSSLVKGEDRDAFLRELGMNILISVDMFCESMDEDQGCFGRGSRVRPGVEFGGLRTDEPLLCEGWGRHWTYESLVDCDFSKKTKDATTGDVNAGSSNFRTRSNSRPSCQPAYSLAAYSLTFRHESQTSPMTL
jgi:hypothetical protein